MKYRAALVQGTGLEMILHWEHWWLFSLHQDELCLLDCRLIVFCMLDDLSLLGASEFAEQNLLHRLEQIRPFQQSGVDAQG